MNEITIFYNYTPDTADTEYFFPQSTQGANFTNNIYNYLTGAAAGLSYKKLDAITYKIYDTYIDLPLITTKDQTTITYIAVAKPYGYYFYFVDKIIPMPQGMRCYTRLDNWASYIGSATINNVEVTRTNLYLGKLFSGITKTSYPFYTIEDAPRVFNIRNDIGIIQNNTPEDLSVYAVIKAQVVSTLSHEIDHINIYEFNAKKFHDTHAPSAEYNTKFFLNFVNSIASIDTLTGTWSYFGTGKAEIMRIYIAPKNLGIATTTATFKGYINNSQYVEITGTLLNAHYTRKNFLLKVPQINYSVESIPGIDQIIDLPGALGNKLSFGTRFNQLPLPTIVDKLVVTYETRLNNNSIQFVISCNGEERDISESFTVTATANNASLTSQETMAKWLSVLGNIAMGTAQIASGGAGVISGGLQIIGQSSAFANTGRGQTVGGGDALITFANIISGLLTPAAYLWVTYYGRNVNYTVYDNINLRGARCKYRPPEIQSTELKRWLNAYDYILKASNVTRKPFIQCTATVSGAPYDAVDEITTKLNEGIKLKFISGK